jgi:transposase InsO family protein
MPPSRRRSARSIGEAGIAYGYYPRVHAELRSLGVRCAASEAGGPADAKSRAARVHAWKEEEDHPSRSSRCACSGPRQEELLCHSARQTLDGGHHLLENRRRLLTPGFLVLDVYSRRIVGWSMAVPTYAPRARGGRPRDGGVWRRKPAAGLLHHSDRGTPQYTALSFGKRLEEAGIIPSMGRAGSALDNAISRSLSCPRSNASSSMGVASPPEKRQPGAAPSSSTWKRSTTVGGCTPR